MIRMMIVEDQQILLDSLADSLAMDSNIEIVAKCTDASQAPAYCEHYKPDLVLMDICNEEGHSGISATVQLKEKMPDMKVVLMTAMPDISFIHDAKEAGADGFVYKNVGRAELLSNLQKIMQNYNVFPETEQKAVNPALDLTERELDILRQVCKGQSRREIAETLFLSENTVRNNINRILMKTGYDSIAQLAIFAVSKGYIVPDASDSDFAL